MEASERAALEKLVRMGQLVVENSDKDTLLSSLATLIGRHVSPQADHGDQGDKLVIIAAAKYLVDLYGNDGPLREEFGDFDKDHNSAINVLSDAPDGAILAAILTLVKDYIVTPSIAVKDATEEEIKLAVAVMAYRHIAKVGLKMHSLTDDQVAKLNADGKLFFTETSETVH